MKQICGVWLPDDDTHFEAHLRADNGRYQYKKLKAGVEQVPENRRRRAIDIGAHVGLWTMQLVNFFDEIVAFEPMPGFFECFRSNLKEDLDEDRVVFWPYALSNKSGDIDIQVTADNSGNSHVAVNRNEGLIVNVSVCRLDGFAFNPVDFMKIDVEGWEYPVVLGAEQTIKRCKPVIVVEQKSGNAERYGFKQHDAVNLLKSWGMIEAWVKAGDHCLKWPTHD